jgi:4-diphosphocytidyl-2-C-methyl-D-erythritol kinase
MVSFPNCKINLGLFITEKRSDGYHNLETIFLPAPLCDVLEIIPNGTSDQCTVQTYHAAFEVEKEKHSCYQSWKLLHELYGIGGVDIYLLKNVPSGAGLGGGSSDSAFTLMTLNTLFSLSLSSPRLLELAAKIGSDNAFFILNQPCYVKGRGHELEPIALPMDFHIQITSPPVSISTQEAYSGVSPKPSSFDLKELHLLPYSQWKNVLVNDFEKGAIERYPIIEEYIQAHYSNGAFYAAMSGSGSSVFGLYENSI